MFYLLAKIFGWKFRTLSVLNGKALSHSLQTCNLISRSKHLRDEAMMAQENNNNGNGKFCANGTVISVQTGGN